METFKVQILKSDGPFYEGELESLQLPLLRGQYGILAHHYNMIGAVLPGKMIYKLPNKDEQIAAVSNGIVKVEDGEVLVLVETAERPEEIDINKAKAQIAEAKEAMLQKKSIIEYKQAHITLAKAISRLNVKNSRS